MNPISVSDSLRTRYLDYLLTQFGVSEAYPKLLNCFKERLGAPGELLAGPFLEATAPYKSSGVTLEDLVADGTLHPDFRKLFATPPAPPPTPLAKGGFRRGSAASQPSAATLERFRGQRALYVHQEAAIRRLCGAADSPPHTVVASGTGSGKTECFLIPAIDWVLRHPTRDTDNGEFGCGVRVLMVYPMNALVNDQIRRLRQLIGRRPADTGMPVVKFGRYTGETKNGEEEARELDRDAPPNQIVSRDDILANPPDILITNFAMLERAMLRPRETPFFTKLDTHAWRMLVLDEAHSYRGAQGIELARLMQRVRATVAANKAAAGLPPAEPVCVATSATLATGGSEEEQRRLATEFSGALFGVTIPPDTGVFFTKRETPDNHPAWKFANVRAEEAAGAAWANFDETVLDNLGEPADDAFCTRFAALAPIEKVAEARTTAGADRRAFLFNLFRAHPHFHWLWKAVKDRPRALTDLCRSAGVPGGESAKTTLPEMVRLFHAARPAPGEQSLLPCRYHLFASALEGVFVELADDRELADTPETARKDWADPGHGVRQCSLRRDQLAGRRPLELARCMGCGHPFVVVDEAGSLPTLDQPPVWERPVRFFAFEPDNVAGSPLPQEPVVVSLADDGPDRRTRMLFWVTGNTGETDVKACPSCGRNGSQVTVAARFLTGQDAPVGVLTEALYEELLPTDAKKLQALRVDNRQTFADGGDPQTGEARKLLIFSDSRANAAYMASYLQDAVTENLLRKAAWRTLSPAGCSLADWQEEIIRWLDDIAHRRVMPWFQESDLSDPDEHPFRNRFMTDIGEKRRRVLSFLLAEMFGTNPRTLEGCGLAAVDSLLTDRIPGNATETITEVGLPAGRPLLVGEARDLVGRIADLMRRNYLLSDVGSRAERPEFSKEGGCLILVSRYDSEAIQKGFWKATKTDNSFTDLIRRWWQRRHKINPDDGDLELFMKELFGLLMEDVKHGDGGLADVFQAHEGIGLSVRWDKLRVCRPASLFRCGKCESHSTTELLGVCPIPRCLGTMEAVEPGRLPADDPRGHSDVVHYTADESHAVELRCEEHTAQLASGTGQEIQVAFQAGQVNVLSCSTTFEMGIDLGDLQAVVLRNMPPGTANYLQRAGRAGRRADSVAFVLTFCQRRPHDRYYFRDPAKMIAGDVFPPKIDLTNQKILERHVNAEVFTEYFQYLGDKTVGQTTNAFKDGGTVAAFVEDTIVGANRSPADFLRERLGEQTLRDKLTSRLTAAFPDQINTPARAATFLDYLRDESPDRPFARFVKSMAEELSGFTAGIDKCQIEIDQLASSLATEKVREEQDRLKKERKAEERMRGSFERLLSQFRNESLIEMLMKHGVLPSFAFPVNVRQLHNLREEFRQKSGDSRPSRLKLDRDGKLALSEYAPGSELVAGKKVYKSVGLRKFPSQEFDLTRWYRWCPKCNHLESDFPVSANPPSVESVVCARCGEPYPKGEHTPRRWVGPRWGYVTDVKEKGKRPGGKRPWRQSSNRSFFLAPYNPPTRRLPDGPSDHFLESELLTGHNLLVLNMGRYEFDAKTKTGARDGFDLCGQCGRAHFTDKTNDRLSRHRPPYYPDGSGCKPDQALQYDKIALGHRYETDALRIDFRGPATPPEPGFWLGLGYAMANAAASRLQIERRDLEVTVFPVDNVRQAVVLYDAVPGGAGHCRQIAERLPDIVRLAHEQLNKCDCAPEATGCYGCLCDYSNQFAHHQLKRGPVRDYLFRLIEDMDRTEPDPWSDTTALSPRDLATAVADLPGDLILRTDSLSEELFPGEPLTMLDLLRRRAKRPGLARRMTVVLRDLPTNLKTLKDVLGISGLTELIDAGVSVRSAVGVPTDGSLEIGEEANRQVWRWPAGEPLGPTTAGLRRNRSDRLAEAVATLPAAVESDVWAPPELKPGVEFRHARFAAKQLIDIQKHELFKPVMTGHVTRIKIIDPYITVSQPRLNLLGDFLGKLPGFGKPSARVCGNLTDGHRGNFATEASQLAAFKELSARLKKWTVAAPDLRRAGFDKEHDRISMIEVRRNDGSFDHFRLLLGYGLEALFGRAASNTEGVLFGMTPEEFERDWRE